MTIITKQALNNLNELLIATSESNWDQDGAKAITKEVGDKVREFILNLDDSLPMPLTKPLPNNSINIYWTAVNNKLVEIVFDESDLCLLTADFKDYGDRRSYYLPDDIKYESGKLQSLIFSEFPNNYIVSHEVVGDSIYFDLMGV
jgi:hypothetical protein